MTHRPKETRMNWSRKYVIVGGSVLALAACGAGAAVAIGSGDEGDNGAHGPAADQAKAAALELFPGGHANAVERDSENGATWEVEVRKSDGSTVDVRLGAHDERVVIEPDSEAPADGSYPARPRPCHAGLRRRHGAGAARHGAVRLPAARRRPR